MFHKAKYFFYSLIIFLVFSCAQQSNREYGNQKFQSDSIYSSEIIDSVLVENLPDTIDYLKLKEEHKRASKNKVRTLKINKLADTVCLINLKFDEISACLKMRKQEEK